MAKRANVAAIEIKVRQDKLKELFNDQAGDQLPVRLLIQGDVEGTIVESGIEIDLSGESGESEAGKLLIIRY